MKKAFVAMVLILFLTAFSYAAVTEYGWMEFDSRREVTKIMTASAGEVGYIKFDSKSGTSKVYLDSLKIGIGGTSTIAKTITNPAAADDYVFFKAPAAMTLTHIYALHSGGTNVTFNIQECDASAANCANVMNSNCVSGTTGADCIINDTTIASGGWLMLQTVSVSGSVTY